MMRALVKHEKKPGLKLLDIPTPKSGPNEVLIRISKTAICGTDVHIYKWDEWSQNNVPVPLTIGHEFMGVIEEVGSAVTEFKVGQRVSGEGHIVCGRCRACQTGKAHVCRNTRGVGYHINGAFADYMAFPASNVYPLPDDISDDMGACLDPLGNATHTALSFPLISEDVLITGAGPIGLMAVAIAKHAGARTVAITDVNPYRLELAKTMGATHVINVKERSLSEQMEDLGFDEGFTVALEMSGHPGAFTSLLECADYGAKVALLGILPREMTIDWNLIIFKGLVLKGIYGRQMFKTWRQMVSLLQSGLDIKPMITHQYPAEDFEKAFDRIQAGESGKVILTWE